MLVHEIIECFGVYLVQGEAASHPYVFVGTGPFGLYGLVVVVVAAAPGGFAGLPIAVVEVDVGPGVRGGACRVLA